MTTAECPSSTSHPQADKKYFCYAKDYDFSCVLSFHPSSYVPSEAYSFYLFPFSEIPEGTNYSVVLTEYGALSSFEIQPSFSPHI